MLTKQGCPESQSYDDQVPQQAHLGIDGDVALPYEKDCCEIVAVAYGQVQRAVFLSDGVVDVSTSGDQQRQGLSMVALNSQN